MAGSPLVVPGANGSVVTDGRAPVKHPVSRSSAATVAGRRRISRMYDLRPENWGQKRRTLTAGTVAMRVRIGALRRRWHHAAGGGSIDLRDGCLSMKWVPAPAGETSFVAQHLAVPSTGFNCTDVTRCGHQKVLQLERISVKPFRMPDQRPRPARNRP